MLASLSIVLLLLLNPILTIGDAATLDYVPSISNDIVEVKFTFGGLGGESNI